MGRKPCVLLPMDGTNKVFHKRERFAPVLEEYGVEFLTPELGGQFPATEQMLVNALQGVDAFFAGSEYVTRGLLEQVPSLKLVQRIGVGYDKVDVQAGTDLGVMVAITPGTLSEAVAEHTFALMLAVAGGIPRYDREVKAGQWNVGLRADLFGATLGILGVGRIGREVVKRAQAFGMQVLAYDPVWDEQFARQYGVVRGGFHEVLAAADLIVLCLPLTAETRGLIGEEALRVVKPTAFLINTARGAVVDESAICQALAEGRLAGYATDVFTTTPPPVDDPLLQLDNVVVTPHVAAASRQANVRTNRLAAECVGRILTGQPAPEGCVLNPEAWPVWRGRA